MFGIFGGGIPSAQSLLSPVNFVNNLYKQPVTAPVVPVNYTNLPPDTTHYTDYRNFNFGNPAAKLNTTQLGLNPGFVTTPKAPVPYNPVQTMSQADVFKLINSVNQNPYQYMAPKIATPPVANQYNWATPAAKVLGPIAPTKK